jgi:3-hydroxybutyryl-CoA dehydrogenase
MMGPGIALTLALGGLRTTILSRSAESAARGLEKARAQARLLADNDLADRALTEQAAGYLSASTAFDETIAGAGLVVESGPEDMAFKQELFARLDAVAGPQALLASNTSGLSITMVAARCLRPERVLTTHFWNPPHLMPLVEIVKGERTSDQAAEVVRAVLVECGKTPVIVRKDRPGQLGNRLQMALVREAAYIVQEGIASADDVDTVAKNGFGLRMPAYGILEHQDVVGLKLGLAVVNTWRGIFTMNRARRSISAIWCGAANWVQPPAGASTIGPSRAPTRCAPGAMRSSSRFCGAGERNARKRLRNSN